MAQVHRSATVYDVCIVGSGAAGGTAAKILTEGGLSVVLLEAGPPLDPSEDFKEHVWPYDLPHRGAGVGGNALKPGNGLEGEFVAPTGAWTIEGEPYTSAPGSNFRWYRSRIVGGRTNHLGRIALRFAPVEFHVKTHDGMGDDWPIFIADRPVVAHTIVRLDVKVDRGETESDPSPVVRASAHDARSVPAKIGPGR